MIMETDTLLLIVAALGTIQAVHGLGFLYVLRWMLWRNQQLTTLLAAHYRNNPKQIAEEE